MDVLHTEFYMVSSGIPPLTVLLLYIPYLCLCLRRGSVPHVRVFEFVADETFPINFVLKRLNFGNVCFGAVFVCAFVRSRVCLV